MNSAVFRKRRKIVWYIVIALLFLSVMPFFTQETADGSASTSESTASSPVSSDTTGSTVSGSEPADSVLEPAAAAEQTVNNSAKTVTAEYDGSPSPVPAAKRPKTPDPEKAAAAAALDTEKDSEKTKSDTLKYGIESEITELIDNLIKNEDPRFSDDIYDLFQATKSVAVREKIIQYFTSLKDPCIEDYCVTILNDPFDTKTSTVSLCFQYIAAVKCKEAVNAVVNLLEGENSEYFNDAVTALGEIGGEKEAVYLSEYLDRDSLSVPQRQQLMKVLGKLKAVQTWDKLSAIVQNEDENSYVRMYAAEAIGEMGKPESIPILATLFENSDPNIRQYAIKGLSYYSDRKATDVVIQGIRDEYYKVRIEAIKAADKQKLTDAVPYIVYRSENDPENVVKNQCFPAIADLNTSEGNDFLVSLITDKKKDDTTKSLAAKALMKNNQAGEKEILSLAEECLKDDKRKSLRYALGKLFAEYGRPDYADICKMYLASKDVSTVGIGLDIYKKGKYDSCKDTVQAMADNEKAGVNQKKARKVLGLKEEKEAEIP